MKTGEPGWHSDHTHPGYGLEALLKVSMDSGYKGFWGIESGMRDAAGKGAAKATAKGKGKSAGKAATKTATAPAAGSSSPDDIKKADYQAVLWTKEVIEKVVFWKDRT